MRRRTLLTSALAASVSLSGCVEYLMTGCESQSKYILKLTEVEEDILRTDPIQYRNLSENEQRLVRETLETGRFETCPEEGNEEHEEALFELGDRVQEHRENGYAYLKYDDRYFQIGLVLSAVIYARTRHHPDETSTPVQTTALPESGGSADLPDDCPLSQDVGVDWPRDLDESTVATFVERYEETYYRQHIIDTLFEPESRLFGYSGWISRIKDVTGVEGGGWRVHFSGVVNVDRGDLVFDATATDPPNDVEVIPSGDVDDELLAELLVAAAETGQDARRIGPSKSETYLERFEQFSSEFEVVEVGDSDTLYFDVDGTTVELVVSASPPNRDHFWDAWYYVDEHVVWRSGDADTDPRDGKLLECREADSQ